MVVALHEIAHHPVGSDKYQHRSIGSHAAVGSGSTGIHKQMFAGANRRHHGLYVVNPMVEKCPYHVDTHRKIVNGFPNCADNISTRAHGTFQKHEHCRDCKRLAFLMQIALPGGSRSHNSRHKLARKIFKRKRAFPVFAEGVGITRSQCFGIDVARLLRAAHIAHAYALLAKLPGIVFKFHKPGQERIGVKNIDVFSGIIAVDPAPSANHQRLATAYHGICRHRGHIRAIRHHIRELPAHILGKQLGKLHLILHSGTHPASGSKRNRVPLGMVFL